LEVRSADGFFLLLALDCQLLATGGVITDGDDINASIPCLWGSACGVAQLDVEAGNKVLELDGRKLLWPSSGVALPCQFGLGGARACKGLAHLANRRCSSRRVGCRRPFRRRLQTKKLEEFALGQPGAIYVGLGINHAAEQITFAGQYLLNPSFNAVLDPKMSDKCVLLLADAEDTAVGLIFHRGVPPMVEMDGQPRVLIDSTKQSF